MTKSQAARIMQAVQAYGTAVVEHSTWATVRNNLPYVHDDIENRYRDAEQKVNDAYILVNDTVWAAATEA